MRVGFNRCILREPHAYIPTKFVTLRGNARRGSVAQITAALEHKRFDAVPRELPRDQSRCKSASDDNHGA
jgi:hypothetical protein